MLIETLRSQVQMTPEELNSRPVQRVRVAYKGQTLGSALGIRMEDWRKASVRSVANSMALELQGVHIRKLIQMAKVVYGGN